MQLYAKKECGAPIFAGSALRGVDYFCVECQGSVRVRGGIHRQKHFYHLQQSPACRQSGKGMEHIQVQSLLYSLLPGECQLECRFPEIRRIADVVWHTEKIIFEIQCAPISAEEIKMRIQDYESLGFRVVWILHDKQFNKRRISSAEQYLTPFPHYYTTINKEGVGSIYDQFDHVQRGIRLFRSSPFRVDLRFPFRETPSCSVELPERLHLRVKQARLFFEGDLHGYLHEDGLFTKALESRPAEPVIWKKIALFLSRPYRILFRYFLEKASA